ncbi:response regulator [Dyella choica]|uniref:Response regulator transcription factor n=1 Tax=Dyella choica TaxID=1927959 RepID=A0A3S0Q6R6_9GAMM|nr:response regulator transcription factor [Dyella choica]RUL79033.1 response regulator transcription factor [Dyella choica]
MKVRVVLGDDHLMLREGLAALLQREPDIELLGHAGHGVDLLRLARAYSPDVVIADVSMPLMNGIEMARRVRSELLPCKVLCLSASAQPRQVLMAMEAGASGYVLKENCYDELVRAIRHTYNGQIFFSAELVAPIMSAYRESSRSDPAWAPPPLTWREREITRLLAEGCSTQQVANRLHISAKTVATHRSHVFRKLNIRSVAELTRYAVKEGMAALD